MATRRTIRYEPDYATRPGEVLEAYLETKYIALRIKE